MSEALQALYDGDAARAHELLPEEEELSVFEAAAFGRTERLQTLLVQDPSAATAFSEDGFTALHLAVFAEQDDAARLLIRQGADLDVRSTGSIAQVPPLGTAAFVGSIPMARLLLDEGADIDGGNAHGFTALHSAAENGNVGLARLLLERGADADLASDDGTRPIDVAATDEIRSLLAG